MKKVQEKIKKIEEKLNWQRDANHMFIDLVEEVGELGRRLLEHQGLKKVRQKKGGESGTIESELSHVLYCLLAMANHYDIDLEDALDKAIADFEKRHSK